MEKANDAVWGNDRNWITTAAKRWRMESFLLCIEVALPIKLFLERVWNRCWSAKRRSSFYHSLTRGVWIGILPSDYQMYHCSSLCLNDIDSIDGRAPLTFKGVINSERICFFQVCQKIITSKQDIQVVFGVTHESRCRIPCPHVRPKIHQRMRWAIRWSNKVSICERSRRNASMLFVSTAAVHIETAAPNSCCYTLWCRIEMWAALLIALLLASSLMAHCSFHDPLLKDVGVWCNSTGFVSGPVTRRFQLWPLIYH